MLSLRQYSSAGIQCTFGDFFHCPYRGVDVGQHRCMAIEYKITDSPLPPLLNVGNILRESLSEDSQNIPCLTLKRRGVLGNPGISA
jgi:hypothetical protein